MVRDAVRKFVQARSSRPGGARARRSAALRRAPELYRTFGLDELARDRFDRRIAAEKRERRPRAGRADERGRGRGSAFTCSRSSRSQVLAGVVAALGVSTGLTAGAVLAKGTLAQKKRWALDLLTLDKVGVWAITEPDSGSDVFGRWRRPPAATVTGTSSTVEDVHHERSVRRHDRLHLQARRG